MAVDTRYFSGTSGSVYYAKPAPITGVPTWVTDVVYASEIGTTGTFGITITLGPESYFVYERATGSPLSSDDIEGEIENTSVAPAIPSATITRYFTGTSGLNYYVKPAPVIGTPTWATDVVNASELGATGTFRVVIASGPASYFIYERATGSPLSTDDIEGEIENTATVSSVPVSTPPSRCAAEVDSIVTLSDLVNSTIDRTMSSKADVRTIRLLTTAVQQVVRDVPKKSNWKYYLRDLRFTTSARQLFSVSYAESSRIMTLQPADIFSGAFPSVVFDEAFTEEPPTAYSESWPSDVVYGEIAIGNLVYNVCDMIDTANITLDPQTPLGADYAGDAYWQRSRYRFNRIFTKIHSLTNLTRRWPLVYLDPVNLLERKKIISISGNSNIFTLRGSQASGWTDIELCPTSNTAEVFEGTVTVAPIIPKIYQITGSDGAIALGTNSFSSASANFNSQSTGAVLRLYENTGDIPYGLPRWQTFISSVQDANTVILSDRAPELESGAVFVVSSFVDIEPSVMLTYVQDAVYAAYCQNHDHKSLATARAIAQKSLLDAIASDAKLNHSRGMELGYQRYLHPFDYAQVSAPVY